jgi:glucose repression regulatory protein TUP1
MYANHRSLVPAGGVSGPSGSGPPPPPSLGPSASTSGGGSGSNGGPTMVAPSNAGPSGPPGGPGAGGGPPPVGASSSSASAARLADLLDFIRQEFDLVGNDAATLKAQRDEFDHRSECRMVEVHNKAGCAYSFRIISGAAGKRSADDATAHHGARIEAYFHGAAVSVHHFDP